MLKKLLKYDFKSVFKYWWIAAVISLAISAAGGFAITALRAERELPTVVDVTAVTMLFVVVLGFSAFSLLSGILVFVRFYKNFFSDEGYLTFTLPVKRSQLLNSKLIMSGTTMLATGTVLIIDVLFMLIIGFKDEIFKPEFWEGFTQICKEFFNAVGFYSVIYLLEAIALVVLTVVFSDLFLFCCITFASIITRKAKVITAIGIYYAANSVFSFVLQIFYLFGFTSIIARIAELPDNTIKPMIALMAFGIVLFFAVFCAMLYSLQYWMLDRKLNLA